MKDPPVECQGAEHDGVHEHPSYKGRRGAFVETEETFFAHCKEEALEGTGESGFVGGLESDFDCVEGMADCEAVSIMKL